jgi:hypothetical protein
MFDKAKDFAGGVVYGFSAPGRTIQNLASKGVDKLFGTDGFGEATKAGFERSTGVDLDTTSSKVGQFAGETSQFVGAGGLASTATKGSGLLVRSLAQGGASAATQALQTGDIGKDEAVAFLTGSISVPAGDGLAFAGKKLTTSLPEWLVTPLLKQAKDAKVQGKDIAPFLVKSGRIGTVDSLITQTDDAINGISTQVDDLLAKSSNAGVTIQKSSIVDDVVDRINQGGGAIGPDDVSDVIERLAPQAKGLLAKDTLTLAEANKLRSSIDKTLGDRGFLMQQLPFNKEVLRNFTNTLRETVKTSGDEQLRPLFDDYAKNIRLRNALLDRASSGGGPNSVGLYDLLAGGGAFAFTGDPVTAIGAAALRRGFESGFTKTSLAKVLTNAGKAAPLLEKLAPTERAIVTSFLAELAEEDQESKLDQ